ncbi:Enoyl-CoA delta isomerase 1, mitochondrial [Lamellibrachia satsuma]|nr:Enoyl-CoA delta isomerase 1, mitochondrial [Lamellibrachia satsuma]
MAYLTLRVVAVTVQVSMPHRRLGRQVDHRARPGLTCQVTQSGAVTQGRTQGTASPVIRDTAGDVSYSKRPQRDGDKQSRYQDYSKYTLERTMALRIILGLGRSCHQFRTVVALQGKAVVQQGQGRHMSMETTTDNISLSLDSQTGIATLKMHRKPVNGLNLEMLTDLNIALEKVESEKSCRGLVLTSQLPKIFCAGLDVLEMYQQQPERLEQFWRSLQNMWMSLYGSRLVTIAAITGHSPAGGCLMAMSCDYRIMATGKYTIGLNETLLGIVAPFWFTETMLNTIGHRETEYALQLGKLYGADEALKVGLVDRLCAEDQVVEAAKEEMARWLKINAVARQLSKSALRQAAIEKLAVRQQEDIENFVTFVRRDAVQKSLGLYLQSLKQRRA